MTRESFSQALKPQKWNMVQILWQSKFADIGESHKICQEAPKEKKTSTTSFAGIHHGEAMFALLAGFLRQVAPLVLVSSRKADAYA